MALKDWSETAANNDDADGAINWLEGQAPSTVNGSARSMMAVLKTALSHIVSAKDYGAVGDGVTDDTAAIQAAIDAAATAGGGTVVFAPGNYVCVGLELKSYVVLYGSEHAHVTDTTTTRLTASGAGIVVDTTNGSEVKGCGVIGLMIKGVGSAVAGNGIRFRDVDQGMIRNVTVDNFADQGILVDSTSIRCRFVHILVQNCLLDRSQSAKIGAVDISGTDHFLDSVEATSSQSALSDSNLYLCGILIRSQNNMLQSCVGEISDVGIHFTTGGARNKLSNCRSDLNFGHGFEFANGSNYNMLTACHAYRNSQETNNTYDGFKVNASAFGNMFAACRSESTSGDTNKQQYGFNDGSTNSLADNRSKYFACTGANNSTALFTVETFSGASPVFSSAPITMANSDTTPSVAGSNFLRCSAVSVATIITTFDDGVNGQDLYLLGDPEVTLANGATLKTNTGSNKTLAANTMYHLKLFNGIWYEFE